MHTHQEPRNVIEQNYDIVLTPPVTPHRWAGVYGTLGLLVLMVMLMIATGAVPLYEWPT